jgi:short subunit dehydrogenase-like uncharacterized protein
MPDDMQFLLYGATGYTGQLIAEYAASFGLKPILAGRSEAKVKALAESLGLEYRVFDLADTAALDAALKETPVVLHAAGPFMFTAKPMLEACLRTGTHYLDITGEIAVFEMAARMDKKAREAGIMLLPGAGFDVVPTDCLALHLKNRMPDATHLQLAFAGLGGGVSQGTAATMAENLGEGGAMRKDGKIVKVPMGHKSMIVPFRDKSLFVMSIPWGDVSTAYHSTGIPNIETYMGFSPSAYRWVKLQRYFNWLLRTSFVRNIVKKRIKERPAGPTPEQRARSKSFVWGRVSNAEGKVLEAQLVTPEGYTLTALTSLLIAKKVLNGNAPVGFQTPAKAYGEDLILEVEGTERVDQ